MRFDLVDMQLFLHVVEAGSITGGAERAHLSLAAASERVRAMEDSLGTPLLERGQRGVRTTPAGETLTRHARLLFRQIERMRAELGDHAEGLKGQVRLLCNTAALSEFLPEALAAFMARHPHVDVDLEERLSHDVVKAVREGAADLGIVTDSVDLSGLETFPFRPDRLVVVASPAQARAMAADDGEALAFSRLLDADHVGLAQDSALYRYLALQAARSGKRLRVRVRLRSFEGICRMVESGVGISIIPEAAARRCVRTMNIVVMGLADAWALRQLTICVRSMAELPRHAVQLIEDIREQEEPALRQR